MATKLKSFAMAVLFLMLIVMLFPDQESVTAQPPGWSGDIRLTDNINSSVTPAIGVWKEYVHVIWCEKEPGPTNDYDIFYKRSINYGETWENTIKLIDTPFSSSNPSIAINQSEIHMVWRDSRGAGTAIYYTHSDDNGTTWDPEINISTPNAGTDDSDIAIWENEVYVVYSDYTYDDGANDFQLYFVKSEDNGDTWINPIRITSQIRDSTHPDIAVNGSYIHIVWMDHYDKSGTGTMGAIFYKNSTDKGQTWSEDINLTSMNLDADYPYIAVNESTIHVVYTKELAGLWQGYYRRSEDNGITWIEDVKILESSKDIGIDGFSIEKDEIHVVGGDIYISDKEIYYVRGNNNGQNWDSQIRITYYPEDSDSAKIAVYEGRLHIVWRDYRDGNFEIYYKQSSPLADLSISSDSIAFSDNIPNIGTEIKINATIQNIGEENVSATIEFYDGDPNNGGVFINSTDISVNISESVNTTVNWIPTTNGTHYIYVQITDVSSPETNLSNNIANKAVIVNGEPELTIPSIYTVDEDSIENQLINLSDYATDDLDSWDELSFDVVDYSNSSIVSVSIFDGHFLSVDALTGLANDNWTGTIEIVIEVTDTLGLTNVSNQFTVTVTGVNDAPIVVNPILNFSIEEDATDSTTVNLTNVFFDSDNSSLYYTCSGNTNVSVVIHDNGSVTFTPLENWTGEETINFYATDNLTDPVSEDVTITVMGVNDPPIITVLSPPNNSNHFTSDTIYFDITVFDIDSDTFTYLWDFGDGTTSTHKNATHQFSEAGIYNVSITVSDGSASDMKIVTIVVEPAAVADAENGFDIFNYLWILIVIIIVIILLFFWLLVRKNKAKKDEKQD